MVVEMARGKKYKLDVPHLTWAYNYFGEFKEANGQLMGTYRP